MTSRTPPSPSRSMENNNMTANRSRRAMAAGLLFLGTTVWAGQQAQPANGVTGTRALEGTVDTISDRVDTITVVTADGGKHLLHFTMPTVGHGTPPTRDTGLAGFG